MKYSESEIINALKVIKETCEASLLCSKCQLSVGDGYSCGIKCDKDGVNISPSKWRIVEKTPQSLFLH